jgi:hypothetical protein
MRCGASVMVRKLDRVSGNWTVAGVIGGWIGIGVRPGSCRRRIAWIERTISSHSISTPADDDGNGTVMMRVQRKNRAVLFAAAAPASRSR